MVVFLWLFAATKSRCRYQQLLLRSFVRCAVNSTLFREIFE